MENKPPGADRSAGRLIGTPLQQTFITSLLLPVFFLPLGSQERSAIGYQSQGFNLSFIAFFDFHMGFIMPEWNHLRASFS